MDVLLFLARLTLAVVFGIASVAKMRDREGTREAIIGFGVPAGFAPAGTFLLPVAEFLTAVLLIPTATAAWGAVSAVTLLILFIIGISVNLAKGRQPDCNCFGQLHSAPVGANTLVRNTLLAGLAGFVLWGALNRTGEWGLKDYVLGLGRSQNLAGAAALSALVVLGVQAWAWRRVSRDHADLLGRVARLEGLIAGGAVSEESMAGLQVGTSAPDFMLKGIYGETVTLNNLLSRGLPAILIFTDATCKPCNELMPRIAEWQGNVTTMATISLISGGGIDENRKKAEDHVLKNVLIQEGSDVSEAYRVGVTPCATVIDIDGAVAEPMACGPRSIAELIEPFLNQAPPVEADEVRAHLKQSVLALGDEMPQVPLLDLSGKRVSLSDYAERDTVVLFWDPGCRFCQAIKEDVLRLDASRSAAQPSLVVMSCGDVPSSRGEGFTCAVLIDTSFRVGNLCGVPGTPSALLLDTDGRIASNLAVGGSEVLDLSRGLARSR